MHYFKSKFFIPFALIILLISVSVIFGVIKNYPKSGETKVSFLDVGQGDSALFETENGYRLLVDAGPDKKVLRKLGEVLPFWSRSIDVILLSHYDSDHIGGLPEILRRYKVGLVISAPTGKTNSLTEEINQIIKDKNISQFTARGGEYIDWGAMKIQILFPDRDTKGWDENVASVIARVTTGNSSFILTGDAPQATEEYLVSRYGGKLQSDVLKVGHHGSKTSSDSSFVSAINPAYSVISVGLNNRYGHPNKETLDLLGKFKDKILETFKDGTIQFVASSNNLILK
jgi:competence protein ComEC